MMSLLRLVLTGLGLGGLILERSGHSRQQESNERCIMGSVESSIFVSFQSPNFTEEQNQIAAVALYDVLRSFKSRV